MIISKCPLRVSLAGGSTDLIEFVDKYGYGSVISFPIDVYTYISLSLNLSNVYRINYSETEEVKDVDLIKPISQGAPPAPAAHPDNGRDQVIQNHYYYYGVPPPTDHHKTPKRKKSKSKRPPTPSSSESESSDEEEPVPHQGSGRQPQQYYEMPKPQYKFSYA